MRNYSETPGKSLASRLLIALAITPIPSIIFEKYTYHLYTLGLPIFFTFSGDRLWFDIGWFCVAGVISALIVGRTRKAAVLPPIVGSLIFIVVMYVPPLCTVKECYISSTDGLSPIRDFLLYASLAVITAAASMRSWEQEKSKKNRPNLDILFQLGITMLMGYALSFFPIMHIFAGVSIPFPGNYFQWFMAGAPAGLACSMWLLDRGSLVGATTKFLAGPSGVALALALAVEIPCPDCSGYAVSISSILVLAILFSIPAALFEIKRGRAVLLTKSRLSWRAPKIITTATIILTILTLLGFYFVANYKMSIVNGFSGVSNSTFSPLEVGRTFVYSGGYLSIPRLTSSSVGINASFGNTSISQSKYPNDFLAIGVGDQSPNCCKDGLDLAYRADLVEFSNGTEAVLARAWWACDVNMACGDQFGVSSAYPIRESWQVYVQCPNIVVNGIRECIPSASFINGDHSFWKVLYTFGRSYSGMGFAYLGNYTTEFYYSGSTSGSPVDGTTIW